MFFTRRTYDTYSLCFKILFVYILTFQHEIPSESFYIVGKSLQSDRIDSCSADTVSCHGIYDILDEVYYFNVYVDKLKKTLFSKLSFTKKKKRDFSKQK
jgi:hypothetical protein